VSGRRRETLVLTLPADPDLSRLTGLVSTHFFRQSGIGAAAARRGGRSVARRCRALARAAGRSRGKPSTLILRLGTHASFLEVMGRAGRGPRICLARIDRPNPA